MLVGAGRGVVDGKGTGTPAVPLVVSLLSMLVIMLAGVSKVVDDVSVDVKELVVAVSPAELVELGALGPVELADETGVAVTESEAVVGKVDDSEVVVEASVGGDVVYTVVVENTVVVALGAIVTGLEDSVCPSREDCALDTSRGGRDCRNSRSDEASIPLLQEFSTREDLSSTSPLEGRLLFVSRAQQS